MNAITKRALGAGMLLAGGLALAQMGMGPGGGMGAGMGPGMMGGGPGMGRGPGQRGMSMVRHRHVRMNGLPAAYARVTNPLPASPTNLEAGKALYQQNCASCHGVTGQGDGPAAAGLNPPPSRLANAVHVPIATDGYLDWTISEGGAPVGSAMPAFKPGLKADQIWQIVTWLRTL